MKRREFITFLGGAAATWPLRARAQEPRQVIGVLSSQGFPGFFSDVAMPAFIQGLKNAGFVEGRNISIEIRLADGHYDRLPSLAAELVGHNVAAICAPDLPAAFAAKAGPSPAPARPRARRPSPRRRRCPAAVRASSEDDGNRATASAGWATTVAPSPREALSRPRGRPC